ncbi:Transmembrane protein 50A [Fragariocoptes setiger]|uniref:Transmembrane protein 50A n=1 Tax=Fragariocoptes setiger TaxID=1670756 RepID=A0ABQ7S5X2_9ACAR|nr:Transmembrane protein 50A [Fragariocoptes setiger]
MEALRTGWDGLMTRVREYMDMNEKRNIFAAMAAGVLFFTGWWIIIDVAARYGSEQFHWAYHLFGVFGTVSFIIVNSISNSQLRDDSFGASDPRAAKIWLLIGFILGFSALTGSIWVLISEFSASNVEKYPGIALLFQNILIFTGSLAFKFGRIEE